MGGVATRRGALEVRVVSKPQSVQYDTLIVDEDTTCVRTVSRKAAQKLAAKLVRDGKSFEFQSLHSEHFEFLVSEENERKGWLPE